VVDPHHGGEMSSLLRKIHKSVKRRLRVFKPLLPAFLVVHPWVDDDTSELKRRSYRSYDAYLAHQRGKLSRLRPERLQEYDVAYRSALRERLSADSSAWTGASVLCLGARLGTEVKAFLDLGCFAIGIDLNPGPDNRYVVTGDFHHLQFPSASTDVVFTNSLDHALDIDRVASEVKRVLKPGGRFVLEIGRGLADGGQPLYYEASAWQNADDVLAIFARHGFTVVDRSSFTYPWTGEHVRLVAPA
jgi:SAM-dependent methyltransferase